MKAFEQYMARYGVPFILLCAILVLLVPLILRTAYGAPITPRAESYLPLRYADLTFEGEWTYDPLENRPITPSPYIGLLSLMEVFGVPWLLPVILVVTLLMLLDRVFISLFALRPLLVRLALLLLAFSPAISVLGTGHSTILLTLVLLCATLLLLERYPLFSFFTLLVATISHPLVGGIGAIAIIIWQILIKRWAQVVYAALSLLFSLGWLAFWSTPIIGTEISRGILFELGAVDGASIFLVLIALFGIVGLFGRKRILAIVLMIVLSALAWYVPSTLILLTIALCIFAAQGVLSLLTAQWELDLLRQLVLILLCCVALFTIVVAARERLDEQPTADFSRAMIYLSNQHRPGAVLTDPQYAHLVEYYSGRKVSSTVDGVDALTLFSSRDANSVYASLERSSTSYVFMTDEMRERLFTHSDEGILFLLANAGRFVPVYDQEGSKIWYYIHR